jgi:hypothetical protein
MRTSKQSSTRHWKPVTRNRSLCSNCASASDRSAVCSTKRRGRVNFSTAVKTRTLFVSIAVLFSIYRSPGPSGALFMYFNCTGYHTIESLRDSSMQCTCWPLVSGLHCSALELNLADCHFLYNLVCFFVSFTSFRSRYRCGKLLSFPGGFFLIGQLLRCIITNFTGNSNLFCKFYSLRADFTFFLSIPPKWLIQFILSCLIDHLWK